MGLYLPSAPGNATLTVSLRAADGDNPSTTALHALTNPQTFVTGTNYFAVPANTVLTKDTTYFVVVSGSAAFDAGHSRLRRRGLGRRGRLVHRGPGAGGAVGRVGRALHRR